MKCECGQRFTDLEENSDGDYTLIDTHMITAENNILIVLDKTHRTIHCMSCNGSNRDHITYVWKSVFSSARLSRLGFVSNH